MQQIEAVLNTVKQDLDDIDAQVLAHKKRKDELKPFVKEDACLNATIGKLKQRRRSLKGHFDFLVEFYKKTNDGEFPDKVFPLFSQSSNLEPQTSQESVAS